MVYYDEDKYQFIKFKKSNRKNKKYRAVLKNKKTGNTVNVHFGDTRYEHYKDSTGLGEYSHLDHNDKDRRERYIKRHKGFIKDGYYSPGMFSLYYLW